MKAKLCSDKDIRLAAMNFLARREYGKNELYERLLLKFRLSDVEIPVRRVIEQLAQEHLVSDQRFAESFVHSKMQAGKGPVLIAEEMRRKQVEPSCIVEALKKFDDQQWIELLAQVYKKKYAEPKWENLKELDKRKRFLFQRGFPPDMIQRILDDFTY